MTKKSKKKSLKTGCRSAETPRLTTVTLGTVSEKYSPFIPVDTQEYNTLYTWRNKKTKVKQKEIKDKLQKEQHERYLRENASRHVYPHDVWFLIAKFIYPEQIRSFSAICKDSYHVCCTSQFWMHLYSRFVIKSEHLPTHLQHHSITTHAGLKTRVVRAIFHVYKPLQERVHTTGVTRIASLETLRFLYCHSFWWKHISTNKDRKLWLFYFKFMPKEHLKKTSNIFKLHNLLQYNPDEHSSILCATAYSFACIPTTINLMQLGTITIGVSHDLKGHKLKLVFYDNILGTKCSNYGDGGACVSIDPVFDVKILNWWHPDYPHPLDN